MKSIVGWLVPWIALGTVGCDSAANATPRGERARSLVKKVKVVAPLRVERAVHIEQGVSLAPEEKGAVAPGVSAVLARWAVEENELVTKGQAVAYLDALDYQMNLHKAEAGLAALEAQRAGLEKNHDRLTALVGSGVSPQSQLDTVDAQFEALGKQIEATRVGLELARRMVNKSTVRAPFSGVITRRIATVGSFINHAMPQASAIALIEKIDRLKANLAISEIYYDEVDPEGTIQFFIPSLNRRVESPIHSMGKSINELKQFSLISLVDNPDGAIPAGVFTLATVASKKKPRVIVPPTAVKNTGARVGEVYFVQDGKVAAQTVATGFPFEDGMEVIGDVPERVIADLSSVNTGETVEVLGAPER